MPYLAQRPQGRLSSQRLHAVAQFVHWAWHCRQSRDAMPWADWLRTACLTCFRFAFCGSSEAEGTGGGTGGGYA